MAHELVIGILKSAGVRLTVQQAAKYAAKAGAARSAATGLAAMQHVRRQHIKECARVVGIAQKKRG
jgi:hypothetical protein